MNDTENQSKRHIYALIDSLNNHRAFPHLLNVAVKELSTVLLVEKNIITSMEVGGNEVLMSVLKECSHHDTIPLYTLKAILALLRSPISTESMCTALMQDNFLQVVQTILQPTGIKRASNSTCEVAIEIMLEASNSFNDQPQHQLGAAIIFLVMESRCVSGKLLEVCCRMLITLGQFTDSILGDEANVRRILSSITQYEKNAEEDDEQTSFAILQLMNR